MADLSARATELFLRACDMRNPAARGAFLARECGGDEGLRQAVDALLEAYDARGGRAVASAPLPEAPAKAPVRAATPAPAPSADLSGRDESVGGLLAGKYKLLEQIGEGGMGSVYMAQQIAPVTRLVAVKVIKAGMDSKEVLARFEAERQALALMDHPNIARVLDAGSTSSGSPFFVMELVKGVPITKFCDERKLAPKARLELFVQVCQAIQHAHHKGIIHRDIKPSNVLVALYDDRPVPKVIDFGVAKAAGQQLTAHTMMTGFGSLVGTPEYMSPEQATLNQLDVDTRSDVYSLGVLLYELLTGTTPLGRETLGEGALLEILRAVREVEAPRPSTRLSTSDALASIAASRGFEPAKLSRLMKGELDWILLKALEKDRARRYESANGLASDVTRYLAGEPVQAVPPSAGYRLRKTLRRNKGKAIAVAATAASLLVGLVAFAWQAKVAGDQRDLAVRAEQAEAEQHRLADAQRDRALKAEAESKARADDLRLVSDFQAEMLQQIDPAASGRALTDDVATRLAAALVKSGVPEAERTAQQKAFRTQWDQVNATDAARSLIEQAILKPAIATIDKKFKDQPLVDAQLRQVLAERYGALGLYAAAMPLQTRALETRKRLLGAEDPLTLESTAAMGLLLMQWGKLADAEPYVREALEGRRKVLGADHKDTIGSVQLLGLLYVFQGKKQEGERIAREALAALTRTRGESDDATISAESNLASALESLGRQDEAERTFRSALEKARRSLGADHQTTLNMLNNLGTLLQAQGRLPEAETCFRELLDLRRRTSGEEHPDTLVTLGNLGFVLEAQGKVAEAEPLLRESLEKRRRVLGEDHPVTLFGMNDMGSLLATQGKLAEAEPYLREAYERRRRVLGEAHDLTFSSAAALCDLLLRLDRGGEAVAMLRARVETLRRQLGEEHEGTLLGKHRLGASLLGLRKMAEAERVLKEFVLSAPRVLGETHPTTLDGTDGYCGALAAQEKWAEAEAALRAALASRRRLLGDEHMETILAFQSLCNVLVSQDKPAEAEPVLRDALRVLRKVRGDEDPETLTTMNLLGTMLQHQADRDAEAEPLLREALNGRRKVLGSDHADTLVSLANLHVVLEEQGKLGEAELILREILERQRRLKGQQAPETLDVTARLAMLLQAEGKLAEAETFAREAQGSAARAFGEAHPFTAGSTGLLGTLLLGQGKLAEAEPVCREALKRARGLFGEDHPETMEAIQRLGVLLYRQRKFAEADPLLREAVERRRRVLGEEHPQTLMSIASTGASLRAQQKYAEAVAVLAPALERARRAFKGPFEPFLAGLLSNLGRARAGLAKDPAGFAEAESNLLEAHSIYSRTSNPFPTDPRDCAQALVDLYAAWDAAEPGKGHAAQSEAWRSKLPAGSPGGK